jgi:hypothetical protein
MLVKLQFQTSVEVELCNEENGIEGMSHSNPGVRFLEFLSNLPDFFTLFV